MTAPERVALGRADGRWVLAAAVLGSGVVLLDSTVVNVALPTVGRELGADFAGLQWTVNGYALSLAALLLLGGTLGDRYGRRRLFILGTVWFAVASLLCGLAPNVEALVAARVLQGVGGALLTPGSLAILAASFSAGDRARAIGAWSGLGSVAAAAGPLLGGTLVEVSWRLVFLINLPVCAVVVLIALKHVPESADECAPRRVDVLGATVGALGLAALTWGLVTAGSQGASTAVVVAGLLGLALLAGFVLVERRVSAPMLPLDVFASRQFRSANYVTFAVYAALGVVFLLLVVHLQVVGGFTPLASGLSVLPVTALMLTLSSRTGALAQRIGPRLPMTVGPLGCALGVLLMARLGASPSYALEVLPAVVVFGLGLATTVAPLTVTALAAATERHAGIASGVNNAVARTAGLLSVAVVPVVAGLDGRDYLDPVAYAAGYRPAMYITAGLLVVGGLIAALTISDAEARVS